VTSPGATQGVPSPISGRPHGMPTSAMALQDRMLAEFQAVYVASIEPTVRRALGDGDSGILGRFRRWLYAPLGYTLGNRRNFFRGAFAIKASRAGPHPEAAHILAASVEIAWSSALILDDIIDRSNEREGQAAAYRVFGTSRCLVAVGVALCGVLHQILVRAPGSLSARIERTCRAVQYLTLCTLTQLPGRGIPSIDSFRRDARRVNISHHWALLSPLAGSQNVRLKRTLARYADHMTVSGKMRNDLLDYYGGSSEREAILDDFNARRPSFPIIVLWTQGLRSSDREMVAKHFAGTDDMRAEQLFALFSRYDVPRVCLGLVLEELEAARLALRGAQEVKAPAELLRTLHPWTHFVEDVCREKLTAGSP